MRRVFSSLLLSPDYSPDVLLPLLIFPFLTFTAVYFILHQSLVQNGLQLKISTICHPDFAPHPYQLPYTNITEVDQLLCGMVAFFHALVDPAYNALLAVLFPAVGVAVLIPFLEASRDNPPFALRMPTAIGVLFQLATMGVIMPFYSLLFVITYAASSQPSAIPNSTLMINQGNAEALLFGLLLGYILPTTFMVSFVHSSVTATWQGFPILFAFAIFVHKLIRPPSRLAQSGHATVMVTLAFTFLLSGLLHMIYVWPIITDTAALRTMFLPVIDPAFDLEKTSLVDGVLTFVKWDLVFSLGSVILGTFWAADRLLTLVGMLVWYGIATILVGPAAAIAGVFLLRERQLNGRNQTEKVPQKME